jgi:uncharacterized protein with HEPN domain
VKNSAFQDAVIRRLEIIGEAAKRVPEQIKQHYSEVPWRSMAAMRDVLIHDYPEIVIDQVWITATKHLPSLRPRLEQILGDLEAAAEDAISSVGHKQPRITLMRIRGSGPLRPL